MVVAKWNGFSVILVKKKGSNFYGTGMALHGILKKDETPEQHRQRCKEHREKVFKMYSSYSNKRRS